MTEQNASRLTPSDAQKGHTAKARPYHHGSLPEALLQAAEIVLKRDGLRGLTLRSIAREAGVSHTAPQHHFGDTAGVLSELAAIGHLRLTHDMATHVRGKKTGKTRRKAIAHAYVDFAVANPDLFRLMSRNELLDPQRPSLVEGRRLSARALAGVFDALTSADAQAAPFAGVDAAHAVSITAAWAYVHGLATLLIDRRLDGIARGTTAFADARELVDKAIDAMQIVEEG